MNVEMENNCESVKQLCCSGSVGMACLLHKLLQAPV